jgi:DNA-binding transcriptional regulator YhcF (GntR family)
MEFRDKQAIYLQLADQVCEAILRGQWREGARIPSIREFAVSSEVNPNTAARTFAHLQSLGVVSTERGTGYCVASGAQDAIRRMKRERFLARDLPDLFKTMHLLGLNWDDLHREYDRSGGASNAPASGIQEKA